MSVLLTAPAIKTGDSEPQNVRSKFQFKVLKRTGPSSPKDNQLIYSDSDALTEWIEVKHEGGTSYSGATGPLPNTKICILFKEFELFDNGKTKDWDDDSKARMVFGDLIYFAGHV